MIRITGICSCSAADAVDSSRCCGMTAQDLCLFAKRLERGRFIWPCRPMAQWTNPHRRSSATCSKARLADATTDVTATGAG